MGILSWLIFGAIVGWLAGKVMKTDGALSTNIIVGIIGSMVGGWLFGRDINNFSLGSIFTAVLGAIILIFVLRLIKRS